MERCVSTRCKLGCRIEFGFERWKQERPEAEGAKSAKKKKSASDGDEVEELSFDEEVLRVLSKHFAPPNDFVSQVRFEQLRMTAATLEGLRAYNLDFAMLEQQCAGVLPPARILAKIYAAGLMPWKVRDRVVQQEFTTWNAACSEALSLFKKIDALSHVMGMTKSNATTESVPVQKAPEVPTHATTTATKKVICFKCQEPGHIAKECPNRGASVNAIRALKTEDYDVPIVPWPVDDEDKAVVAAIMKTTKTKKTKTVCYSCGHKGHISRECPAVKRHWVSCNEDSDEDDEEFNQPAGHVDPITGEWRPDES